MKQGDNGDSVPPPDPKMDALYAAWVVIANAYDGDWSKAPPDWHKAALRWRDQHFHPVLAAEREAHPAVMVQNHPPRWMDRSGVWHDGLPPGHSAGPPRMCSDPACPDEAIPHPSHIDGYEDPNA